MANDVRDLRAYSEGVGELLQDCSRVPRLTEEGEMTKNQREAKEGAEQFGRTGLGGRAEAAKRLLWERLFKLPDTQLSPSEGRPCPGNNGGRSCFRRAGHGGRKGIPGADRKASSGSL